MYFRIFIDHRPYSCRLAFDLYDWWKGFTEQDSLLYFPIWGKVKLRPARLPIWVMPIRAGRIIQRIHLTTPRWIEAEGFLEARRPFRRGASVRLAAPIKVSAFKLNSA